MAGAIAKLGSTGLRGAPRRVSGERQQGSGVSVDAGAVLLGGLHLESEVQLGDRAGMRSRDGARASALFAGDVCVPAGTRFPAHGRPVPWAPLVSKIRAHDIAFANLECPLTLRARAIDKAGPSLWGDPGLALMLADGGFDGVTLANNHVLDAGAIGVEDTIAACQEVGLSTVGAGADLAAAEAPLVAEVGGLRIAVVACAEREFSIAGRRSAGAAPLDPWRTPELVREAARSADVVIVVLHGGNEFFALPRPGLVAACRGLVAAGAHAVVCHHAHVAGPVEVFRGAPIFYGTGNFLFPDDAQPGLAWHLGYAVSLVLTVGGVLSFRLLPYHQCAAGLTVRPMGDREERAFVARLLQAAGVVQDPDLLAAAWEAHCKELRRHYLYVALGLTRVERRLLRYGIWPAWRRPRRRIPELLDTVTCDSHREALELILLKENRR